MLVAFLRRLSSCIPARPDIRISRFDLLLSRSDCVVLNSAPLVMILSLSLSHV